MDMGICAIVNIERVEKEAKEGRCLSAYQLDADGGPGDGDDGDGGADEDSEGIVMMVQCGTPFAPLAEKRFTYF